MKVKDKLGAIIGALYWTAIILGICLLLNDRYIIKRDIQRLQTQIDTIKDTTQRQTRLTADTSKFRTTETINLHIDRHYHYNNDTKNNYEIMKKQTKETTAKDRIDQWDLLSLEIEKENHQKELLDHYEIMKHIDTSDMITYDLRTRKHIMDWND